MKKPIKNIAKVAAIGAGIGYLAGLLTAKQSGKETREDIANTTKKVKDTTEAKIDELHKELIEVIEQVESKVGSSKEAFKGGLATAKKTQAKASDIIKAVKSGKANDKDLADSVKNTKAAIESLRNYLK